MPGSDRFSRRRVLATLGASSLGVLGGCNWSTSRPNGDTNKRMFDGGDASAFAAALEDVATDPGATLEIAPGTYRFEPVREQQGGKWRHFNPPPMEGVTIEGNGATIVFTEPAAGGFKFQGGSDIAIRNLTFDYDPVPFTQGVIQTISNDERTAEVELDEGYPQLNHEMFDGIAAPGGSVHTPDGEFVRGVRAHNHLDTYYTNISKIGDRLYQMELTEDSTVRAIRPGLKQLFKARRDVQIFAFTYTDRPTLENVTIQASNGAGMSFAIGDRPTVRNCAIAPPENSNRLIGVNADGVRFVDVKSEPSLENSRLEYLGDDPIVVQHSLTAVTEVIDERTVRLGEWPIRAQPDDTFKIISEGGERLGTSPRIESMEYRQESRFGRGKPETVTFETTISNSVSEGDLLGNQAVASHDFVIRNNTVRNVRGNLIRIAASHGTVENNTLEGAHRNGIEIECETNGRSFTPKGGVIDVTVRNNNIRRPGLNYRAGDSPSGIRVHHRPPGGVQTEGHPNQNVTIDGNTISDGAYLGIEIENAADVRIMGNEMHDLNQLDYPETGDFGVLLDAVEKGRVVGNQVTGPSTQLEAFGLRRNSTNIEAANNELEIDGASQPGRLLQFVPLRISFSETFQPEGGHLWLAIRCYSLSLHTETGETVVETDMSGSATGFSPGEGVYKVEQEGDEYYRWIGGENETATMYLYAHHLEAASTMRLEGTPFEDGISGTVSANEQVTDTVDFGTAERQVYEISLDG